MGMFKNIAQERMDELQEDLRLAQLAKEQGITFQEAKRNQDVRKKYIEFLKMFDRPGVDKKRADAIARHTTNKFFSK